MRCEQIVSMAQEGRACVNCTEFEACPCGCGYGACRAQNMLVFDAPVSDTECVFYQPTPDEARCESELAADIPWMAAEQYVDRIMEEGGWHGGCARE